MSLRNEKNVRKHERWQGHKSFLGKGNFNKYVEKDVNVDRLKDILKKNE